jgi:hypothetical protein
MPMEHVPPVLLVPFAHRGILSVGQQQIALPVPLEALAEQGPPLARHGLVPVLLVNSSPLALLQPIALARPAVLMNIRAVALQQHVWQRMLPPAPPAKD